VASGYLPHRILFLLLSFRADVIYTYSHIGKFVPLHPYVPMSPTTMSQGPEAQFRHVTPPWQGESIINHHDYVFPGEGHRVALARVFVEFSTLSEGP
jgi:hypothetical protein